MLFSQPELAAKLSQNFECAWEELRPAPKIRVDFGNGHVLERTVNGNVATLFLTPEGNVFDVVPGILEVATYDRLASEVLLRFAEVPKGESSEQLAFISLQAEDLWKALATWPNQGLVATFDSKNLLEDPIKQLAELAPPKSHPMSKMAAGYRLDMPGNTELHDEKAADSIAGAKRVVEFSIKQSLLGTYQSPEDKEVLRRDTETAVNQLRPQALRLLANQTLPGSGSFSSVLFREVLHVDLEDPFLGLAPDRIGGRLGRYGPMGPDGPVPAAKPIR